MGFGDSKEGGWLLSGTGVRLYFLASELRAVWVEGLGGPVLGFKGFRA